VGRGVVRVVEFLLLGAIWSVPARAQTSETLSRIAVRLASNTAVTGFEQAMVDTMLGLLPGGNRDRAGNARFQLGGGSSKRLLVCPLDEPGYVVGSIRPDGYLTLRRAPGQVSMLFDQQIEGQQVTIHGHSGPVPGVVAVRSIHLTRGRGAPSEEPFTVDDAYVDVGSDSAGQTARLGIRLLAPVTLTKRPHQYGDGLLAAPVAGRRAACAAVVTAVQEAARHPGALPAVTVAFVVEQELSQRGLSTLANLAGPFAETVMVDGRPGQPGSVQRLELAQRPGLGRSAEWSLPVRYAGTAVETVSMKDAATLRDELIRWLGAGQ
jgi:putative aminopeptidase